MANAPFDFGNTVGFYRRKALREEKANLRLQKPAGGDPSAR
jgi:hypothetical protein